MYNNGDTIEGSTNKVAEATNADAATPTSDAADAVETTVEQHVNELYAVVSNLQPPEPETAPVAGEPVAEITPPATSEPELGPEWSTLGELIKRCPVEFGKMLFEARKARKLTQRDLADAMTAAVPKTFGRLNRYDDSNMGRWERGNIGKARSVKRTGREAKAFLDFYGWDLADITAKLQAIETPAAPPALVPPTLPQVENNEGLATREALLMQVLVQALQGKTTNRNELEDQLLQMVGIEIDIVSMLTAGLLKLPPDQQTLMLANMLQVVCSAE